MTSAGVFKNVVQIGRYYAIGTKEIILISSAEQWFRNWPKDDRVVEHYFDNACERLQ
jgi:hypothetical protein